MRARLSTSTAQGQCSSPRLSPCVPTGSILVTGVKDTRFQQGGRGHNLCTNDFAVNYMGTRVLTQSF